MGNAPTDTAAPPRGRPDRTDHGEHRPRGPRTGLAAELRTLEGAQYGRYKGLVGRWEMPGGETLELVRAQSDPYAPPARVAVHVPGPLARAPA